MGRFLSLLILAACFEISVATAAPKPVVIVSVDGLGSHLLSMSKAPTIMSLGQHALRAETVIPTKTLPAHTSMMSGVSPEKHGILLNENDGNLQRVSVPTIFDLAHGKGLKTAAVVGKEKIKYIFDDGSIDEFYLTEWPLLGDWVSRTESYVVEGTSRLLKKDAKPSLLFIHFALVDSMGHTIGWESRIQRWSVEKVDRAMSRILKSLDRAYGIDGYYLILTSDHGGHGMSHGQMGEDGKLEDAERDQVIPWVVRGASLRKDVTLVRVWDTAPTAAAMLGLEVPASWKWEGRSVVDLPTPATQSLLSRDR